MSPIRPENRHRYGKDYDRDHHARTRADTKASAYDSDLFNERNQP